MAAQARRRSNRDMLQLHSDGDATRTPRSKRGWDVLTLQLPRLTIALGYRAPSGLRERNTSLLSSKTSHPIESNVPCGSGATSSRAPRRSAARAHDGIRSGARAEGAPPAFQSTRRPKHLVGRRDEHAAQMPLYTIFAPSIHTCSRFTVHERRLHYSGANRAWMRAPSSALSGSRTRGPCGPHRRIPISRRRRQLWM